MLSWYSVLEYILFMGQKIGVCLLGCGVVGGGVQKILREQRDLLRARTDVDFELVHVAVKDRNDYPPDHEKLPMTTDANAAIDDTRSQVIIELIGGTGVAGTFVERALKLGKPVVTANKSLLAARGPDLFALARKHNTCIGFEASCGGGIPIIGSLLQGLIANDVQALLGIVNGAQIRSAKSGEQPGGMGGTDDGPPIHEAADHFPFR